MNICGHCQGFGRWGKEQEAEGAPPLGHGFCGIECGQCKNGLGEQLGLQHGPGDWEGVERWKALVIEEQSVERLKAGLAAAEARLAAARAATENVPSNILEERLGIPPELLKRIHWMRD